MILNKGADDNDKDVQTVQYRLMHLEYIKAYSNSLRGELNFAVLNFLYVYLNVSDILNKTYRKPIVKTSLIYVKLSK